ncbi:hypothetical protein FG386_002758 [Cryptosporidium ryanae]|uniref:uncharacterized protein n=1 Tax=Cryptosporidium ryanae TaxID=515981 RepID=UPI00351AAAEF|nr:hypothetical protein FG386_002758 [Cryptosporidium ryanae]
MAFIGNEIKSIDKNLQELDKTVKNLEDELLKKQKNLSKNIRKSVSRPQSSGGCGIESLISKSPKKNSNTGTLTPNNSFNINGTVLVKSGFSSPNMNVIRRDVIETLNKNEIEQNKSIPLTKGNSRINNGLMIENEVQFVTNQQVSPYDNIININNGITTGNFVEQQNCTSTNQFEISNGQTPSCIQFQAHNTTISPAAFPPNHITMQHNINHPIASSYLDKNAQMFVQVPNQVHLQQIGSGIIEGINQNQLPPPLITSQLSFSPQQPIGIQNIPFAPQRMMAIPQQHVPYNYIQEQIPKFPGIINPQIPTLPPPQFRAMIQGFPPMMPNGNMGMMDMTYHLNNNNNNNIPITAIPCSQMMQNPNQIPQNEQNNISQNNNPLGMDSQMLAKYLLTAMAEECILKKNSCVEKGTNSANGEDGFDYNNSNYTGFSSINDSKTIIRPLIQPPKTNIDFSSPKSFSQDVFRSKCRRKPKNNNYVQSNDNSTENMTIQQEEQVVNERPISPPSSPTCFSFKASVPVNALGDNLFSESLSRIVANKITKVPTQPTPMQNNLPPFIQNQQHIFGSGYNFNNNPLSYVHLN